jgi:tRNA A-37 threonylcarbamoyl transferase component Bud32
VRRCPTCQSRYTPDARVCPIDGAALEEAPDPLVGRTIGGRYLVSELIGTGGMGTVYRGRHQLVGRDVALKFLAPRYARDPSARERFLREARAANRIDHEHIIDITDFGETSDNLVFLVMEYLEGEPLGKALENGPLETRRALTIAWQLATALARAHELDVIHRDIKPDNIFLLQRRGGDFVKLLDFGLAKVMGEHRLTATGKVFGTPEYLAPEQARGDTLTGAADQYSLGCVLYEMLTGELPFEGPSPEVVLAHLQVLPRPPSQVNPRLPLAHELDQLVLRMLAKHPGERFSDAYHLADELRTMLDQLQGGRPSKPPRRSGLMPAATPESSATQPWLDAAEETWAARLELYGSLAPRAFPAGAVPPEVRVSLAEMSQLLDTARSLRAQLGENVLRAKEHEDGLRAARLRVGHAVDELGQDESRVARRITEAREALAQARANVEELGQPIVAAWRELPPARTVAVSLTRPVAELFRNLGAQAALWLEAEAQAAVLEQRALSAEREREDLRFQIAQLKGRLGILNAEGDSDLGGLREQADVLEAQLSRVLDGLHRASEPIVHALSAVPSVRDVLTTARMPSPGREVGGRS